MRLSEFVIAAALTRCWWPMAPGTGVMVCTKCLFLLGSGDVEETRRNEGNGILEDTEQEGHVDSPSFSLATSNLLSDRSLLWCRRCRHQPIYFFALPPTSSPYPLFNSSLSSTSDQDTGRYACNDASSRVNI